MPWIIDRDLMPEGPPGTNLNAKNLTSRTWTPQDDFRARYQFRMLDDDGAIYYYGRSTARDVFAPLDDFGAPNAGCTRIEYFNTGKGGWYSL